MAEIIDFSDLAESKFFSYNGTKYEIPAISNKKAKVLFSIGKNSNKQNEEENNVDDVTGFQRKFICTAVRKADNKEYLTDDEFDELPINLTHKVFKMINESISTSFDNGEETKKS